MSYLDTHVALWLYLGRVDLLSDRARDVVESMDCGVSPMVLLELRFLTEIGRLVDDVSAVLRSLATTIGLRVVDHPLGSVVENAQNLSWTRDPFDRLITAQAMAADASLITRDRSIRAHYDKAVW